eukprot:SAG11_NODE_75_length_18024_cov_5.885356_20_plen_138_part_00
MVRGVVSCRVRISEALAKAFLELLQGHSIRDIRLGVHCKRRSLNPLQNPLAESIGHRSKLFTVQNRWCSSVILDVRIRIRSCATSFMIFSSISNGRQSVKNTEHGTQDNSVYLNVATISAATVNSRSAVAVAMPARA